ncbi:ATP-binding protein [Acetobacteraceae bacterium]|nr:ATP-binding protein [Acetobacteraceae bacterium]
MNKKRISSADNFLQLEGNLMLKSFALKNFQSFKERSEISFLMNERELSDEWAVQRSSGEILGTVLGIWGANASGKTSILKAFSFLSFFLQDSFEELGRSEKIPVESWFNVESPTLFEVVWVDNKGTVLTYHLELTKNFVHKEFLTRRPKGQGGSGATIFRRNWDTKENEYILFFGDSSKAHFEKYIKVAKSFRKNTSFISSFLQHRPDSQLKILTLSGSNVTATGHLSTDELAERITGHYFKNPNLFEKACQYLRKIDLGLTNLEIKQEKVNLPPSIIAQIEEKSKEMPELKKILEEGPISLEAYGLHDIGNNQVQKLPLNKESSGTRALYALLGLIIPLLQKGGQVILDEIDNDLHPHIVEDLLELFNDNETNPGHAQLIFVSHNPHFMRRIGKSHIWLTEKIEGTSEAYSLSQMKGVRSDENFEAKYLGGAYGALPFGS